MMMTSCMMVDCEEVWSGRSAGATEMSILGGARREVASHGLRRIASQDDEPVAGAQLLDVTDLHWEAPRRDPLLDQQFLRSLRVASGELPTLRRRH
jgi:hypothetical protein